MGNTAKISVKVKAIDSNFVILEDLENKTYYHWPIKNIPQPLEVGNEFYLELLTNNKPETDHSLEPGNDQEDQKRKLLEELVN